MPDDPGGARGWLRRLWPRRGGSEPPAPGSPALMTGLDAALAIERACCDVIVGALAPAVHSSNAWGRGVTEIVRCDAADAVTEACGLAMTGRRATVVLPVDGLAAAREPLAEAARWRVPLVVLAPLNTGTLHDAAPGAFVLAARSAQDAVDLLLVARRTAEITLTPGILLLDDRQTARAVQDVLLPLPEALREWYGETGTPLESPSPAQALLFGGQRARVPAWFDLDRPVSRTGDSADADGAAAVAGREAFFADPVGPTLQDGLERLAAMTGRNLAEIVTHGLENATAICVAYGSSAELAETVCARLRATRREPVGTIALPVVKPLPEAALIEALASAKAVTVIERAGDPLENAPPLVRALTRLTGNAIPVVSARVASQAVPLGAPELEAVFQNMKDGDRPLSTVWLGLDPPSRASGLPREEVLTQRIARDYPGLAETALPSRGPFDARPAGARTITLVARRDDLPDSVLFELAAALRDAAGPHIRARLSERGDAVLVMHVTAADVALGDPGDDPPAEIVLVAHASLAGHAATLKATAGDSRVFVVDGSAETDLPSEPASPAYSAVRERGASIYGVDGGARALVDGLPSWLAGGSEGAREPSAGEGHAEPGGRPEQELPLAVRRYASSGRGYDDVSRFWGEHVQPRRERGSAPFADPFLAAGATPPATASFDDRSATRTTFPRIDPALCSGCGACWVSCPDASIAPVALTTHALLDATITRITPDPSDDAAIQLRRAVRQLATQLDARLAESGSAALSRGMLDDAFDAVLTRLDLPEETAAGVRTTISAVAGELERLPLAATEDLFHGRHRVARGTGALLGLTVSPQSCQGCGVCADVCPEGAISIEPESLATIGDRRASWSFWEALPDTPGEIIAAATAGETTGPLAAGSLSRHGLLSVVGGGAAEPGSGERIAVRQIASVIEHERQRVALSEIEVIDDLSGRLREALRTVMTHTVETDDLDRLERALDDVPGPRASVTDVETRLGDDGVPAEVDLGSVRELVRTARELEALRALIEDGAHGTGRARYGIAVAGSRIAEWAARFGSNPFTVPVVGGPAERISSLALGIAGGLAAERADEARLLARARALLATGAEREAHLAAIDRLDARGLTDEERALSTPIVLLADEGALEGRGAGALLRLLETRLPVKLVILDGRDLTHPSVDAGLLALARREAFAAATSIAHPAHLHAATRDAITFPGPALLHVHAPSPSRHGFSAEGTIARARGAVACRVHPLFRYDPRAEGVFGQRLDLGGNPDLGDLFARDDDGAPLTPADWALGEARYHEQLESVEDGTTLRVSEWADLPNEKRDGMTPVVSDGSGTPMALGDALARAVVTRAAAWRTLQELAGVVTPFTDSVRASLEKELRSEHAAEMANSRASQHELEIERLRSRLLELAGVELRHARDAGGDRDGAGRP